jgi:hypothetical protein
MPFSGGMLVTSQLGKLVACRIHLKQSAAVADLMMQLLARLKGLGPAER